jgi:hypothetical protein
MKFGSEERSIKDLGIFIGWIVGILLLGGVLWFFTQSVRTGILLTHVNQALVSIGDSRQLDEAVTASGFRKSMFPLGTWYTLKYSENRALVFSIMTDGILLPCVAVVSASGTVDAVIPLTSYSKQIVQQLAPERIKIYRQRIERIESQRIKVLNR